MEAATDVVFDIGNSGAKGAFFAAGRVQYAFRLDLTPATATADDWAQALDDVPQRATDAPVRAGLCSVVPEATSLARDALHARWGLDAFCVRAEGAPLPFALAYRTPATLGADRLSAAAAAWAHHAGGRSVLALDAGTALTCEVVRAEGDGQATYAGGVIAPGPALMRDALTAGTAQLPPVPLELPPGGPVGATTEAALQSGLMHGFLDIADGLLRRLTDALGEEHGGNPVIVATGGWGDFLHARLDRITDYDPHLVPRGIHALMTLTEEAAGPA